MIEGRLSRSKGILAALFTSVLLLPSAPLSEAREQRYDVLISNGTIFDGSGAEGRRADLAIREDRIAAIGSLSARDAATVIDASGLAVAPGFINMLSWATDTLIVDGHSQSNIRQGVTLEIFGEGLSMGPLNEAMKREMVPAMGELVDHTRVPDWSMTR